MDLDSDDQECQVSPPVSPTSSELCALHLEWIDAKEMEEAEWAADEASINHAMYYGVHPQNPSPAPAKYNLLLIHTNPGSEKQTESVGVLDPAETVGEMLLQMGLDPEDAVLKFHTNPGPPHCAACSATSSHWISTETDESIDFISSDETGASLGLALGSVTQMDLISKSTEVLLYMEYNHKSAEREYFRVLAMRLHRDSLLKTAAEEAKRHIQNDLRLVMLVISSSGEIVDLEKTPGQLQWIQPGTYSEMRLRLRSAH